MPRIRPSHAAGRAPRRRASRLRRTAFVGAALVSLLGLMACVVQVQAQDRGHRRWSAGHGAFASDQRNVELAAAACWNRATRRAMASGDAAARAALRQQIADCRRHGGQRPATSTTATTAPPETSPAPGDPPATTAPPATSPPATTSPADPPPSTPVPSSCAPVRITAGGTYSGCYTSTSTGTPAVTLATSQPVRLDHARVIAKGYGVQDTVSGTRLTVVDSTFEQRDPGAVVAHRAIELQQPASFVAEHNRFSDGDGIWIGGGTVDPLAVRSNLATNIGRYPHPTSGNCCVQFLQLSDVTTPAGEIAWNHVQNISGQSGVEDNINLFRSGGSSSSHKVDIHHNLIDGAYPRTPSNTQFTGGGIIAGDGGGGWANIHDNTVVSTTNYGVSAGANGAQEVTLGPGNVLINDTKGSDGSTNYLSDFGQANSIQSGTGNATAGYQYNWRRDSTQAQFRCWSYNGQGCGQGTQVSTTEQQARAAWAASVPTSVQPIGPR